MKKFISFLVVVAILIQGSAISLADNTSQFYKSNSFTASTFSDISTSDWFYEEVANCYNYGFISGVGQNKFAPNFNITIAQAITLSVRINSAYTKNSYALADGPWYQGYINYAIDFGLIKKGEFDGQYDNFATREQVAYILANCLPDEEFNNLNKEIYRLPDVDILSEYYMDIIKLYRAGITKGNDENGNFAPKSNITRAQVAAMVNRTVDKSTRKTFNIAQINTQMKSDEIAALCMPAVFQIATYRNKESYMRGSGFFIDASGIAITNYHVISGAQSAKILTNDGKIYEVESLLGSSRNQDIAILKIKGSGFNYLKVGDSEKIRNGQHIYCIGSPIELFNTISEGIVSSKSRALFGTELIQISAPISPGSSGGVLLDDYGQALGITSGSMAAYSAQQLNFAVPSKLFMAVKTDNPITLSYLFAPNPLELEWETYMEDKDIPNYGYLNKEISIDKYVDDIYGDVGYKYKYSTSNMAKYTKYLKENGWVLSSRETDEGYYCEYWDKEEKSISVLKIQDSEESFIAVLFTVEPMLDLETPPDDPFEEQQPPSTQEEIVQTTLQRLTKF